MNVSNVARVQGLGEVRNHGDELVPMAGIPVLSFDQTTRMEPKEVNKLNISMLTRLSEHPFYRDSFFRLKFNQEGKFEVTRCRLDPPSSSDAEPMERIVARLMPEDCHFRVADIRAIGERRLGLRHVSSHEIANGESERGVIQGCSLNISFCGAEYGSGQNAFYQFHEYSDEAIERRLPQYESGIDDFINASIWSHDLTIPQDNATLQRILDSAKKTAFLVLNYDLFSPCDSSSWGKGLGRFPKANVSAENVTLLRTLDVENWDIDEVSRKQYAFQFENVMSLLVAHYRKSLLDQIRT